MTPRRKKEYNHFHKGTIVPKREKQACFGNDLGSNHRVSATRFLKTFFGTIIPECVKDLKIG
ncbi:hypothetical protein EMIT07CA2_230003 [Brevibacillus sp. IT-7CA2]